MKVEADLRPDVVITLTWDEALILSDKNGYIDTADLIVELCEKVGKLVADLSTSSQK